MSKLKSIPSAAQTKIAPFQAIRELADEQLGPLAEAIALADVFLTIHLDNIEMCDGVKPTLSRMLCERLDSVRKIVETEVSLSRE